MHGLARTVFIGALTAAILGLSGVAIATDEQHAIGYRKATMQALGAHTKATGALIKGEVSYEGHLARHTAGIASIGGMLGDLFPEGSDFGDTRALPAIWEKPDEFTQVVQAIRSASAALADAGKGGDMEAVRAAFGGLGKACKGCHEKFREKKQ